MQCMLQRENVTEANWRFCSFQCWCRGIYSLGVSVDLKVLQWMFFPLTKLCLRVALQQYKTQNNCRDSWRCSIIVWKSHHLFVKTQEDVRKASLRQGAATGNRSWLQVTRTHWLGKHQTHCENNYFRKDTLWLVVHVFFFYEIVYVVYIWFFFSIFIIFLVTCGLCWHVKYFECNLPLFHTPIYMILLSQNRQ